jgi:hypothetical protein
MKKQFLLLSAIGLLLFSCKNESSPTVPKSTKRDTTLTLAVYLGYKLAGYQYGVARKITLDTLVWVGKDSATMKKEWAKFTYFDVDCQIGVKDSITAAAVGIKNWNGRDTVVSRLLQADAKYVRDGVTNWDSTVKYLKQYMDTTKPKVDSLNSK